ncbi:unnamed protein product [Arabis nemorensis]|uniref:SURP motif domain-containing protein n=1 Tax=Arabis nemorensis TaxID=586526 RepID=A0A565AXL4_9BRAS|nr:unnamed protein product [Arabis nemorensis]
MSKGAITPELEIKTKAQNPPKDLSNDRRASISPTELTLFCNHIHGTELNLFCNHIHLFKSQLLYRLVDSYEQVLQPYSEVLHGGVSEKSLLARFIHCPPVNKLEETTTTATTTAIIDFDAFVTGVDSFAHMDSTLNMPRHKPLSLIMNQLTETTPVNQYGAQDIQPADPTLSGISLVELDIIKLTGQFVARYGPSFQRALMRRVAMKPQFEFLYFRPASIQRKEFMEQTESSFIKWDACTAALLEDFLGLLQLEKLEERVETAMIDLHAFVCGLDYFTYLEDVFATT